MDGGSRLYSPPNEVLWILEAWCFSVLSALLRGEIQMDLSKGLSDSMALVVQLIKDVEAASSAGAAFEAVISDSAVQASLAALVKDILG